MNSMEKELWPGWKTGPLIGRGSFGAVYEIERKVFGYKEKAALKVISLPQSESDIADLRNDGYDEESIISRFEGYLQDIVKEYSMMADMKGCANIVYCDDVKYIRHDDGIGWDIFIKMELLSSLPEVLGKTISDEQVIKIGTDICNALAFCEKRNLLHRDIKPQNIFVAPDGTYKLGDFGIAKTAEHTTSGTKTGTYKYMAPEVYNSQPYGRKADIYSLGLVLYWLLNERRMPFQPLPPSTPTYREEEAAKEKRFGGEKIPAPAHGGEGLKQIVLRACEYDPKDRYQSAEEMKQELRKLSEEAPDRNVRLPEMNEEALEEEEKTEGVFPRRIQTDEDALETDATISAPKDDYQLACSRMTEKKWKSAAEIFERLGGYQDAAELAKKCRNLAKREKNHKIVVIAGGAFLLLALIIGGLKIAWDKRTTTPSSTATPTPTPTPIPTSNATEDIVQEAVDVGDIITFGSYEQDNNLSNGKEEIEWLVLDVKDDKALVISRYALDSQPLDPMSSNQADYTWENCWLRAWLNDTFLNTAFSKNEQEMIRKDMVYAYKNPFTDTDINPGNMTEDQIFLLSIIEAKKYFDSDDARKCAATKYAIAQGDIPDDMIEVVDGKATVYWWWWLRTPGDFNLGASDVTPDGYIYYNGIYVGVIYLVRPAMWISTSH